MQMRGTVQPVAAQPHPTRLTCYWRRRTSNGTGRAGRLARVVSHSYSRLETLASNAT